MVANYRVDVDNKEREGRGVRVMLERDRGKGDRR